MTNRQQKEKILESKRANLLSGLQLQRSIVQYQAIADMTYFQRYKNFILDMYSSPGVYIFNFQINVANIGRVFRYTFEQWIKIDSGSLQAWVQENKWIQTAWNTVGAFSIANQLADLRANNVQYPKIEQLWKMKTQITGLSVVQAQRKKKLTDMIKQMLATSQFDYVSGTNGHVKQRIQTNYAVLNSFDQKVSSIT